MYDSVDGDLKDPESPRSDDESNQDSLKMNEAESIETRTIHTNILSDKEAPKGMNMVSSTKYTLLTWLPITIGAQFRRLANIYFLLVSTLMLIGTYAPWIFRSPLEPMSTISTLFMVLLVTSCKEGYDDLQRWEFDNVENIKPVTVITWNEELDDEGNPNGNWKLVEVIKDQQDVCPGDIVKLSGKCRVPCDMILMHTSRHEEGNTCYVETSNIDGETSLKVKCVPSAVSANLQYLLKRVPVQGQTTKKIQTLLEPTPKLFDGELEIEKPNNLIYTFVGALHLSESACVPALDSIPLGSENLLLRSSVFCNTDWAMGICVYSGKETRIQMNNRLAPLKMSNLEKYANKAIVCVFTAQCILVTIAVIGFFSMGYNNFKEKLPYIYPVEATAALEEGVEGEGTQSSILPLWLEQWIVFLILFNNFIPISLYVTMELVNLGQADLVSNDEEMYDEELDKVCAVKTGNLLQELGQISHIFSDKTGTLTKNEMKLKYFTVNNIDINVDNGLDHVNEDLFDSHNGAENLYDFCRCLVLCHTVVREQEQEEELVEVEEGVAINLLSTGLSAIRRRLTSFEGISSGFADAVKNVRSRLGSNDSREGGSESGAAGANSNNSNLDMNNSRNSSTYDLDILGSTADMIGSLVDKIGGIVSPSKSSRSRTSTDGDLLAAITSTNSSTTSADNTNTPQKQLGKSVRSSSPTSSVTSSPRMKGPSTDIKSRSSTLGAITSGSATPITIREHNDEEENDSDHDTYTSSVKGFHGAKLFHINAPNGAKDLLLSAENHNKLPSPPKAPRGYRAESPDELALVLGTRHFNCHFIERRHNTMEVEIMGQGRAQYEQIAVNSFNSDRKRMSVLMRNVATNEYFLFCKGADMTMLPLLNISKIQLAQTNSQLHKYAVEGLRTLVVAQKQIDEENALIWLSQYREAGSSMIDRNKKLDKCAENIENNLSLLGITAIEDKLQDDVPAVINDLSRAGVTLWMLTGDKEETALNIGMSCNLLLSDTHVHSLTNIQSSDEFSKELSTISNIIDPLSKYKNKKNILISGEDQGVNESTVDLGDIELAESTSMNTTHPTGKLDSNENDLLNEYVDIEAGERDAAEKSSNGENDMYSSIPSIDTTSNMKSSAVSQEHALVIDGPSFAHFIDNIDDRVKLLGIGNACRSVVACRLTPLQKAQLVALVKKGTMDAQISPEEGGQSTVLTLAVGDGANDVPMIQEADVGIGIFGKEGNQAANQADFAIAQFKYLRRLLLVHGRSNYIAQVDVCMYCLHKNMVLTLSLFWYSYYTSMSGTSLYESWIYSAFNLALGLPIIFYGILDKDLTQEFVLKNPEVYETSRTNSRLTNSQMAGWLINGLFYAMIICNLSYIAFQNIFEYQALYIMGTTVWTGLVMALQGKVAFMSHSWSWPQFWCMFFSIGAMFPYFVFASYGTYAFYKQAAYLFTQWDFWLLGMFTVPVVCVVLVDVLWNCTRSIFWPTKEMLYKEMQNIDIYNSSKCEQYSSIFQTNVRINNMTNGQGFNARQTLTIEDRIDSFSAKIISQNIFAAGDRSSTPTLGLQSKYSSTNFPIAAVRYGPSTIISTPNITSRASDIYGKGNIFKPVIGYVNSDGAVAAADATNTDVTLSELRRRKGDLSNQKED